ncbi:MAG: hypothetical protein KHX37_09485, partial [Eubacterium sp.]|nr:hypothetical protein [Eubacterium sp.]
MLSSLERHAKSLFTSPLLFLNEIYDTKEKSLKQLKQWNETWYEEISPQKYTNSLGNPAFCVQEYGK